MFLGFAPCCNSSRLPVSARFLRSAFFLDSWRVPYKDAVCGRIAKSCVFGMDLSIWDLRRIAFFLFVSPSCITSLLQRRCVPRPFELHWSHAPAGSEHHYSWIRGFFWFKFRPYFLMAGVAPIALWAISMSDRSASLFWVMTVLVSEAELFRLAILLSKYMLLVLLAFCFWFLDKLVGLFVINACITQHEGVFPRCHDVFICDIVKKRALFCKVHSTVAYEAYKTALIFATVSEHNLQQLSVEFVRFSISGVTFWHIFLVGVSEPETQ